MKTIIMEPNFANVEADVLVIGVPEHPENITGWDDFVSSFSSVYQNGLNLGMLKLNLKVLSKCQLLKLRGYKRVLFIGLGLHKRD